MSARALCHEWTLTHAGSERVAAHLARALDIGDVFTFAADPEVASSLFAGRRVETSVLGRRRFVHRHWRWFLPAMSRWWRNLDLSSYDLVVTSSHAVVNSVRTRRDALHVSYCYTPMRYAWLWRSEIQRIPSAVRWLWPAVAWALRVGDRRRARNVDVFIADSHAVAGRIARYYGRKAAIVHPPVDTAFFTPPSDQPRRSYFLYAGRFVPYKRPDVAIAAANLAGTPLIVAGWGPDERRLRAMAGKSVEFRINPSNDELRDLYRHARGLVFPGVEDFGLVMAEAQSCATPVIAYAEGGALDIVRDGVTGVLYADPSPSALARILRSFDPSAFRADVIRRHADAFGFERFDSEIRGFVAELLAARGVR